MPTFQFDESDKVYFDSKFDGRVCLKRQTWESHITNKPERGHLKYNGYKIATTLLVPDYVRESRRDGPGAHLYYKEFTAWKRNEEIELPVPS